VLASMLRFRHGIPYFRPAGSSDFELSTRVFDWNEAYAGAILLIHCVCGTARRSPLLTGTSGAECDRASQVCPGTVARTFEETLAPASSTLPLPRALVVFAHPDDEVIALGARLERFRESRFICVTDGAPRDGADAHARSLSDREEEQTRAVRLLHLPDGNIAPLWD
jgi:hypothetical protein